MQPPLSLGKLRYRSNKYRDAMTKTEQCKVPKDGKISRYEEWLTKEYNEYCLKSKSNNIIMCPQKIIHQPIKEVQFHNDYWNDYFKNVGEKSKNAKTKKKGKDRRNKKKKKESNRKKKTSKKNKKKSKKNKKKSKKNKKNKKKSKKNKKSMSDLDSTAVSVFLDWLMSL